MSPPAKPTHNDIYEALERLRQEMQAISSRIGHENDDGKSGTGLTGRIMRTEARVLTYDRLKERAIGAGMAFSVMIAVLWWITRDRWAAFFGVHG